MWIVGKSLFFGLAITFWFQNPAPKSTEAPKVSAAPANASSDTAAVAPAQPVITVHGTCEDAKIAPDPNNCATVVTREQFENLVKVLSPDGQPLSADTRKIVARTYADYLAVEAAARSSKIEDSPELRALMRWTRLKAITDFYRNKIHEEYRSPAQEEIDTYYKEHRGEFERVKLARVVVPRDSASAPNKDEFDRKAHEIANTAQEDLVKGFDPVQVQRDAYIKLGLAVPPTTDLGNRRRADMIPREAVEIFGLKPGEVSQVETGAQNYVIYKVLGKDVTPEDQVKKDISRQIYEQKFKDAMKSVLNAAPAEFNEQYFESGTSVTERKSSSGSSSSSAH